MKKILIILTAIFVTSCSESFLDITPSSSTAVDNFYQTETQFTEAVNGAYASLRTIYSLGYVYEEMRSDNTHFTRNNNERMTSNTDREDVANFLVSSTNSIISDSWASCYSIIAGANTILDYIDKANLSDDFKNDIIGKAKFVRAFAYFELVQNFGRVPLQLHAVTNAADAFPAQAETNQVYDTIISDVKDAIDKLPTVSFPQDGSATKGAAKMLYAYVLLTKPEKDYVEAQKQLEDITKMKYDLLENYADVFNTSMKNSVEHIFSIQYMQGNYGMQSDWLYSFMPRSWDGNVLTGTTDANTSSTGGWNVPTDAMIASYEPGDKRLPVSVNYAVGTIDPEDGNMEIDGVLQPGDPSISEYSNALPFVNKYHHTHNTAFNTDDNWPVYRYADALLLLAECLVDQQKNDEALPYVNQVRARAGLDPLTSVDADAVANERKHELAFENHRWYDLVRTGKALEVMTNYAAYIKSVDTGLTSRTYNITAQKLLFPIPYRELQINKKLTQNKGAAADE